MPHKSIEARRAWKNANYAADPEVRRRHKEAAKQWEDEHREERNAYRTAWAKQDRDANMERRRAYEFVREMKKYSTTVEWYRDKLIEQGGLCAMCHHLNHSGRGKLHRLQVDHDHSCCDLKTKSCGRCLRGLLCETCNMNLSYLEKFIKDSQADPMFKEDSWSYRAMQYLVKYRVPRFWRMK